MMAHSDVKGMQQTARLTGALFLFFFVFGALNWEIGYTKLAVAGNALATARNVIANQLLFRIGVVNELIISLTVIALNIVLYQLLKSINSTMVVIAFVMRLIEAVFISMIAFFGLIVLLLLNSEASIIAFTSDQLHVPVGFFLNNHGAMHSILVVFQSLGLIVYSLLFFKSRWIPRFIACLGIAAHLLLLSYALINILVPSINNSVPIICWAAPSILFELTIGLRLMIKGVKTYQQDKSSFRTV